MDGRLAVTHVCVITEHGTITDGTVIIEDGYIKKITEKGPEETDRVLDGKGKNLTLVPGFIDIHIHGADGFDVMDATEEALRGIASCLPAEGTTSFLATTMTQAHDKISTALENAATFIQGQEKGNHAEVLGIHLEGPFISEKKAGAQPESFILDPSLDLFTEWQKDSGDQIKVVTLAPERPHATELIRYLKGEGVLASLGHTDTTFDEANEAVTHGASHVTHLFNQMSALHHREPGLVGAALTNPDLMAEIIVDHVHVHPAVVKHAFKSIGSGRVILITDAMRAKGLPEGRYELGGQEVHVQQGEARLKDGTLAGSVLTMENAVVNMKAYTTLEEVVQITSANAARQLGLFDRIGSIREGKEADLVLLNENREVVMTFCKGQMVYEREGELLWK